MAVDQVNRTVVTHHSARSVFGMTAIVALIERRGSR
jgi:hypothetical protein